jgi:hypothetical protein
VFGLEEQRHPPAFHFGIAFDFADEPEGVADFFHDVAAEFQVGHFAAFELQRELDLVAFLEELAGVVDLDFEIVIADADGAELEFFELAAAAARAALVFLLLLLVAPLAVIHDSANRRAGGGGYLDEVEPGFAGHFEGLAGGDGTQLFILVIDQKDGRDSDLLVVAKVRRNGVNLRKLTLFFRERSLAEPAEKSRAERTPVR